MKLFTKGIFASVLVLAFMVVASTASAAYTHTTTLKMGSTGSQVVELQKALNGNGFLVSTTGAGSPGLESSYFGSKTKSAVMAYQSAKGLGSDGVVGPNTGTSIASLTGGAVSGNFPAGCTSASGFSTVTGASCASNPSTVAGCAPGFAFSPVTGASCTGTTTPTTLSGGAGDINAYSVLSQYNNEEVGEGQNDVIVAGWEVEADNGSDLSLSSVRLTFNGVSNTGSKNLNKYFKNVSVWVDGVKVGSASESAFSKSSTGIYTNSVSLSNAIVKAKGKAKLTIAVSATNVIDSADMAGDAWTVDLESVRFNDATGAILTSTATLSPVAMNFVTFGTASNTELKISKDSDSPKAGIVIIDDTATTKNVVLLKGKLKLSGKTNVTIDELPVTFTVGSGLLSNIASNLTLKLGSKEYSESTATTGTTTSATITFDDLDFDLNAGDTVSYEVRADINGADDVGEGNTLLASITSDNRSAMDVENEQGDQVLDSNKSGTAIGEAQELRSSGISVALDGSPTASSSNDTGNDNDTGTFRIKFKVTAIGDDAYVGTTASKYTYAVDKAGTATVAGVSAVVVNLGGGGNSVSTTTGGNWKINEGTTVTLELTVNRTPGNCPCGLFKAALSAIGWDISDSDAVMANSYTSNMDDFKTSYVSIN